MNIAEILKKGFDTVQNKVANTSFLSFNPVAQAAEKISKATTNTIDDKVVAKVKEYTTPKAVASGANSLAKGLANGFATFASSAITDPVRLGAAAVANRTGNETAKKIATTKVGDINYGGPVGEWMGPVTTYGDRFLNRKEAGQGNLEAGAKSAAEAALDEPFGYALKPVGFVGSLALKEMGPAFKSMVKTVAETKSGKAIAEAVAPFLTGAKKEVDNLVGKLINKSTPADVEKAILDAVEAKPGTALDVLKNPSAAKVSDVPDNIKLPEDQRFLNTVSRLDVPQKQKSAILSEVESVKKTLSEVSGGPLTTDEVVRAASKIQAEVDTLFTKEGTKKMAANYKAAMDTLASISFKKGVSADELKQVLTFIETYKTNAGRLLNSVKMGGKALAPEMELFMKVQDDLLKQGKSVEDILKAAERYDLTTIEGQQQLYRDLANSSWEKWLDKVRMNSMLSSPSTHFINLTSNLEGIGLMRPLVKAVAGGIDAAKSAVTGAARTQFAGEVAPYLKGLVDPKAWKEGASRAADALKGIQSFENVDLRSFDLSNKAAKFSTDPKGYLLGRAEAFLDFIPRLTSAVDALTATVGKNAEEAALKFRASKGVQLAEDTGGNINKLISKMADDAMDIEVFRGKLLDETEGAASKLIGNMTSWAQKGTYIQSTPLRLTAKFMLPFLRTAGNIMKTGTQYTPFGLFDLIGSKNKTEVAAKLAIGGSVMAATFSAVEGGKITAGYPVSESERDVWEKNGITPYSVYIGGKWVSYEKLHPAITFPMAMAATISQANKESKYSDKSMAAIGGSMAASIIKFVGSQGYARSLGSLVGALNGDEQEASKILGSIPSQLVPGRAFLSWIDRLTSPVVAKTKDGATQIEKMTQQMLNQMPDWIAEPADFKVDKEGKALPNPGEMRKGNVAGALLSALGFKASTAGEATAQELLDFKNAEAFMKAGNKKTADEKKVVDATIKAFNNAPDADTKKEILKSFLKENPALAKKFKDTLEKKVKESKYTPEEKKISGMSKKVKLEYIKTKMGEFGSKAEKIEYLKHLKEVGLIE